MGRTAGAGAPRRISAAVDCLGFVCIKDWCVPQTLLDGNKQSGAENSYDNALTETINGIYKCELIHRRAPWKTKEAVELAILEWVLWFNTHGLPPPTGYVLPAEAEADY